MSLEIETYEKNLSDTKREISSATERFVRMRQKFVEKFPERLTEIKDPLFRLKYIIENLCMGHVYLFETEPHNYNYAFSCEMSEVEEITRICAQFFPEYKVSWSEPGVSNNEYPIIEFKKARSKERAKYLQRVIEDLRSKVSELQREEHSLQNELAQCLDSK